MRARTGCSVLLVPLVLGAVLLSDQPAVASCAPPGDPREALANADAAFIGRVVSRRERNHRVIFLTFRVRERVKGRLGRLVRVYDEIPGSTVSLEGLRAGRNVGLVLTRRHGRFLASNCDLMAPRDLRAAAEGGPWPAVWRGRDRLAKVSFALRGPVLTVAVGRAAPPRVRRALRDELSFYCRSVDATAIGAARFHAGLRRATVILDKDIFEAPTASCGFKRASGARVASAYLVPSY